MEQIGTLKDMHLKTDLQAGGKIVVPIGPEWQKIAERLQAVIRNNTGTTLPIVSDEMLAGLHDGHRVMLGSAMNNAAMMALYRRQYAFVDDFYPGKDGYVLQTVHNPEGCGHNALIVGASTLDGARVAIDQLAQVLGANTGLLGYTNVSRSDVHEAMLPQLTPDVFYQRIEAGFRGNAGRGPIEQGISFGLLHHLTHDADCARMFRDVLFYYEDLVKNRYQGEWCFEHMLFIYAWVWRLFYVWDLIEESDAFSDADRLRMTQLLWGLTHYVANLPYFRGEALPPKEIRQNHSTFAALSMSFGAGYFKTYYGRNGFEKQLRFCQAIFDGQADCYKPNDDGGGGGYCWLVPNHLMTYDLKRDNFRFLSDGHLRQLADYAILITDNLGSAVGFGDVGSYGMRRKASPGVAMTLCKAAWHYNEGGYLWALSWMGGQPQLDCYYQDIQRRVPEWMTGVTVAPFNQPLYTWAEQHGPGGANVPIEEAFDKLTFREGFDEADFYLLLDGTSTFAHGHDDGNSIERLTWKGRMWLAETDYIWRRPRHHSSVVSICDGESVEMPSLVGLKWAEDFGDMAFSRTVVPNYNGVNWTRDLFWAKGQFLLVADSLEILKDADYDLHCLWRTLGDVHLDGSNLMVAQQGVCFGMINADDSKKTVETEEARVTGQDPYAGYDYAKGPIQIFKQQKAFHGRAGDVARYFNLMVAGTQTDVAAWHMERLAENAVRITGPEGAVVFGVGVGTVGPLHIDAEAFVVTKKTVVLLNGRRFGTEKVMFDRAEPVHAMGQTSKDAPAVKQPVVFHVDEADLLREAVESGKPYVHHQLPKTNMFVPSKKQGIAPVWQIAVLGAVSCVDVQGDVVAVGTDAGEVALIHAGGQKHWRAELGALVKTVHLCDLGDGLSLLAGGRDCRLSRFDASGRVMWQREFAPSHGRDQIVNAVTTAHLYGTGEMAIVTATDGWLVWALTPAGDEVWQRQIEHHAAQSLVVADVERDGKKEILVGTEYYNSNLLEADGRIRWTIRGGPCYTALALTDLNQDQMLEAVYGSMDGYVSVFHPVTGALVWKTNLGDDVRHGFAMSGGFVAGSESGNVAFLTADGKRRWRKDLNAAITGLTPWGETEIVAATAEGWVVWLSLDGEVVAHYRADASVTALARVNSGLGVLMGTAAGQVAVLSKA